MKTPQPVAQSRLNKKRAKIVGLELYRIAAKRKCLKPSYVVDEARPEKSPLHQFFTWDNGEAGELWREEQARQLIRSVRVVRFDDKPSQLRKYVSVRANPDEDRFDGTAYLAIEDVRENDEYKKQALDDALTELRGWRKRYDGFKEFFSVYAEIDSAARNINAGRKAKRVAA